MFGEERGHLALEVRAVRAAEPVERHRVGHEVQVLARVDRRAEEGHRVGEHHGLVVGAVDEQEPALQPVGDGEDRRGFVALRVLLRGVHVALAVAGLVARPVGDRCAGHPADEAVGLEEHQPQRHVAAVRPAVDSGPVEVGVGDVRADPLERADLVEDLQLAEVSVDRLLEPDPAVRRAAAVESDNDVALARHEL